MPRSHSLTSLRWGRRVFSAFIDTTSPLLLYPRRSSLLNRPACSMSRRGDFFAVARLVICLLASSIVSKGGEMLGGEIGSGAFSLVGLCAGGCLSRRASVILNVVAMGTVGCGAFVPRSRKLHLLSIRFRAGEPKILTLG